MDRIGLASVSWRRQSTDDVARFTIPVDERPQALPEIAAKAGLQDSRFDVTRPAISQHLKILVDAELVSVRKQGTRRLYRVRPEGLAELRGYLQAFWQDGLLKLAEAAEEEERIIG